MKIPQIIQMAPDALYAAQQALEKTDWTQLNNCGLTDDCIAKFSTYRAAILVIRKQSNLTSKAVSEFTWPNVPTEEWS